MSLTSLLQYSFSMLVGRLGLAIPALALAGTVARQHSRAATIGTLPRAMPLFDGLVIGTILIVEGLTFFPALSPGFIVEHFALNH